MEKSLRVRLPCGVIRNVLQRLRQLRWRGFTLLLSWATVAGGLWIFLVLTEEVLGKDTHEVEKRIMLALRNPDDLHRLIGPSWLEHAAVNLTALGSVSVLTLLVVLVAGYFLVTRQFVSAALLLAFIVGLTRILIGVHYPSDVLAGWTIGAVWAVLCWLATDYWRARLDRA